MRSTVKLNLEAFLDALPECDVYINMMVEIEVLAKSGMGEREEAAARTLLDSFKWVEIDKTVRAIAIQILRAKELRLADALIAASAITLNATVLLKNRHPWRFFRLEFLHSKNSNKSLRLLP